MTRQDKIAKKIARKAKRIQKRKDKDQANLNHAPFNCGKSVARRIANGTMFICEMGYEACEHRGFCNGDC